jgi:hypothetical protein
VADDFHRPTFGHHFAARDDIEQFFAKLGFAAWT